VYLIFLSAVLIPHTAPGDEMTPSRMVLALADTLPAASAPDSSVTAFNSVSVPKKKPTRDITPSSAMYHSLFLSGWGQMDNGRRKKAALCLAAELFCVGGFLYEHHLQNDRGLTAFERDTIRTDRNTFVLYWLGVKLFSMVDAYVDAQLRDYDVRDVTPPELRKNNR